MAIYIAARFSRSTRANAARYIFIELKTESFYLRAGRLRIRIKESPEAETIEEFELTAGDCMDVPRGLVHQMEALEDAELYEFSTQHFDSDSHRLVRGD